MTKRDELMQSRELLETAKEMFETEKEMCLDSIAGNKCDETKLRTYLEQRANYGSPKEQQTSLETIIKRVKNEMTDEEKNALFEKLIDDEAIVTLDDNTAEMVVTALEMCARMMESEQDLFELEKELNDETKEYTEFLTSMDYYKLQEKKVQQLKDEVSRLEKSSKNEAAKIRKIKKSIRRFEGRYTFGFIDDSDTDVKVIARKFFSDRESNYIMERFRAKCKQAGFNPMVYRNLFNIEEKVLEEKYHPFNNLFLFRCLRYVGWCDSVYDKDEIGTTINLLSKLVYDKFPSEEIKEVTLQSLRDYLDKFIEAGLTDEFLEKNILHPKHPVRLKKDKEREEELRKQYYDIFLKNNFVESITPEIEAMTITELRAFLDKKNLERGKKIEEEKKTIQESAEEAANSVAESVDIKQIP